MSTSEGHSPVSGLDALDAAVAGAVGRIRTLESELAKTRARRDELEALLERMNSGAESPAHMAERLKGLQSENAELREKITQGQAVVERLLARVNYLQTHG